MGWLGNFFSGENQQKQKQDVQAPDFERCLRWLGWATWLGQYGDELQSTLEELGITETQMVNWLQQWQAPLGNERLVERLEVLGIADFGEISVTVSGIARELRVNVVMDTSNTPIITPELKEEAETLHTKGIDCLAIGDSENAVRLLSQVVQIDPENVVAYVDRSFAYRNLKRNIEAIIDCNQVLQLSQFVNQPNRTSISYAFCNRGAAFADRKQYKRAIEDFDKAINMQASNWKAWTNYGATLLEYSGHETAIEKYEEGLCQFDAQKEPFACAHFHWRKGEVYYQQGQMQANAHSYFAKATQSYEQAYTLITKAKPIGPTGTLDILTDTLTILRAWSKAHYALNKVEDVDRLTLYAIRCLEEASATHRRLLRTQFQDFCDLKVDHFVNSRLIQPWQALAEAEKWKTLALQWLTNPTAEPTENPPNLQERVKQLTHETAILYWHLSPAQITTFLLRPNQDPHVVTTPCDPPYDPATKTQTNFTEWLKNYKERYEAQRKPKDEAVEESSQSNTWQTQLPQLLQDLAQILKITDILPHLQTTQHLILIPHRDLHLLPLHALFTQASTVQAITYLPQLTPLPQTTKPTPTQPPTLIGYPTSNQEIRFAQLETNLIAHFYPDAQPLTGNAVTPTAFAQHLQTPAPFLHFTGHGTHNATDPTDSTLYLADDEPFTLAQLLELPNVHLPLVCLAACETGISNPGEFINEFVGFPAVFLAKGSQTVLSTLWTVNEQSSMVFMVEFFRHYHQHHSPAIALRHAQTQLQTLTYADLEQWYQQAADRITRYTDDWDVLCSLARNIAEDSETYPPDSKPYADPYHWAGFVITERS